MKLPLTMNPENQTISSSWKDKTEVNYLKMDEFITQFHEDNTMVIAKPKGMYYKTMIN